MSRPGSALSPIMEAVQAVPVGRLEPADAARATAAPLPKRMVIVSDMLENGAGGSHYRGVPSFSAFKASPAYPKLRSHLDGVGVTILYLRRDNGAAVAGRPPLPLLAGLF